MDEWNPAIKPIPGKMYYTTAEGIEEYMKSLKIEEEVGDGFYGGSEDYLTKHQKGANGKQVAGSHYSDKSIQPWDFIYANNLGYFEGNCVKYVSRWKDKGGIDDLKKAIHYLEKLIELEEGK